LRGGIWQTRSEGDAKSVERGKARRERGVNVAEGDSMSVTKRVGEHSLVMWKGWATASGFRAEIHENGGKKMGNKGAQTRAGVCWIKKSP